MQGRRARPPVAGASKTLQLLAAAAVLPVSFLAPGCEQAPTSALVMIESDLGDDLQSVYVQIRSANDSAGGAAKSFAKFTYGERFSFGVVPDAAPNMQFVVVATGMSCEDCQPELAPMMVLAQTKVGGRFVPHSTISLTLTLHAECRGVVCDTGATCDHRTGGCVPIAGAPIADAQRGAGQSGANDSGRSGGDAPQSQGGMSGAPVARAGAGGAVDQGGRSGEPGSAGASGRPPPQAGSSGMGPGAATGTRVLGDSCKAGSECQSTWCADGVCCQSQCADSCRACNLPDSPGVCTALAAGSAPAAGHPTCDTESQTSCGKDGKCDGSGHCERWKDVVCNGASCDTDTNSATAAAKCDGQGTCVAPTAVACTPYTCDASGVACNTTCSAAMPCAPPNPCVAGSCGAKPNGSTCSDKTDCTSGMCVDGHCCDSACSGRCEACDLPANPGKCTAVTSGQPRGARAACAGSAPCAGACTADSRLTCSFPGSGTACRAQSCVGSMLTAAASCDGAGHCPSVSSAACPGNLACNGGGTACLESCTRNADCGVAAPYCVDGSCTAARPDGSACTSNGQCENNHCVDGFCCNSACTGQCEACDVAMAVGTCSAVTSGDPHGSRAACAGEGTCGGSCASGSRSACTYPDSSTQCAAASCASTSELSPARFCNGAGTCTAAVPMACPSGMCNDGVSPPACTATCFVAGTPVDTADGLRPIESIRAGDLVRTFNELTGRYDYRKVIERERRVAQSLVRLTLRSGSSITMSPEHQFWVEHTGWVRAALLTLDDRLLSSSGEALGLDALETLAVDARAPDTGVEVFNLLVEQSPTYFVGADPVLVHSCDYVNFSALDPLDTPQ